MSNHYHSFNEDELQLIYEDTENLSQQGQFTIGEDSFKRNKPGLNIIVVFDVGIDLYENFYFKGDILSVDDAVKNFPIKREDGSDAYPSLSIKECLKNGGVNLKPYKAIVKALLG